MVVVILVGAVTLVTSYTATTSVPTSHVGTSVQPRLVAQLAPQGCSSLAVTTLEHGSGSISNSLSHVLILGSAANDTITDTGASNCIVAGGGSNTVNGPSTDICITGPTNNIANQCGVHSNGVTAAHSADNYSNYGGQERITLTNVSSITALTITIKVVHTTGVAFSSQETSFPGGTVNDSESTSGGFITYLFTLNAGQTIPANFADGTAYAQFSGTGAAHALSGDTWTVTSTSGGVTSTLTGTF